MPGKVDWLARGLPSEREKSAARVADVVRDDVVTCGLDDRVGEVRARVEASPYGFALVVAQGGTLLGRMRKTMLEGDAEARCGDVMEPGPSTVRPDTELAGLVVRLRDRELRTAVVTTPEGRLRGVVRRAEAEALLERHADGG